jgi:hypothetical protein
MTTFWELGSPNPPHSPFRAGERISVCVLLTSPAAPSVGLILAGTRDHAEGTCGTIFVLATPH